MPLRFRRSSSASFFSARHWPRCRPARRRLRKRTKSRHGGAAERTSRPEQGEQVYNLNTLFDALKVAPDAQSAKAIEERIWAVWIVSGSDTCNLLMGRARAAAEEKDYDLAIKLPMPWSSSSRTISRVERRATIYYLKKDYAHSIADIREVLSREPRHFGAVRPRSHPAGDRRRQAALEAYRKVLAIDPHQEHVAETVKSLSEKVEGRDI